MFRAVFVASLAAAAVAVAAGPLASARSDAGSATHALADQSHELPHLLGFVEARRSARRSASPGVSLVRLDPTTLRPLPGKAIPVGTGGSAPRQGGAAYWTVPPWTLSPNAAHLLVARNASSLRLIDAGRLRVVADIQLDGNAVGAVAWFPGGRVLAIQEAPSERQTVVAVDLANRKVASRRALGGSIVRLARTPRELVMLVAPARTIGRARIAVADSRGRVRLAWLERMTAGSKLLGTGAEHRVDSRAPGLAVDPHGQRAFVVDTNLVAEIDVRTLTVSYHGVSRPASVRALRNRLGPVGHRKQVRGYARSARWLGGGLLAVSGADTNESGSRPAGLSVIDTRSWSTRVVEPEATTFVVSGTLLLATGGTWDAAKNTWTGIGVAVSGFDGRRRFQVFDGENSWLAQVHGGRAYVGIAGQDRLWIVDLATGSVVGERRSPLPWLVQGVASGWWEP